MRAFTARYEVKNFCTLLLWLLPFIEAIGDDKATLALLPSVTKYTGRVDRLSPRIVRREADLDVLRPPTE